MSCEIKVHWAEETRRCVGTSINIYIQQKSVTVHMFNYYRNDSKWHTRLICRQFIGVALNPFKYMREKKHIRDDKSNDICSNNNNNNENIVVVVDKKRKIFRVNNHKNWHVYAQCKTAEQKKCVFFSNSIWMYWAGCNSRRLFCFVCALSPIMDYHYQKNMNSR